jgi:YD repeat-containing protein
MRKESSHKELIMNRALRCVTAAMLVSVVGCSDATGPGGPFPPPDGPLNTLLVTRVTAYFASAPGRQASEFTYDEQNRLIGYQFGEVVDGEIQATIRKDFVYREDGLPWGHDSYLRAADGSWTLRRIIRYAYDVERGLPIEVHQEVVEEDGTVVVSSIGLGYDEFGRLTEMRQGPEIHTFTYDRNGDVARARSDDIRFGVQVMSLEYSHAWNPFAEFPPQHDVNTGLLAIDFTSLHLSNGFENAVEGSAPAAIGTATVATNEFGYPTRREYTSWNTTDPDVKTVAVTEYEYMEPNGE